ncbi:DUF3011 domain-containing protein [Polymorphobacter fuscus]|nr:DUF3011 domain-containing protein [Polymorphobacter fuscus]NJC07834.1 hypothetical protein [Polymorphobacter fuscus]
MTFFYRRLGLAAAALLGGLLFAAPAAAQTNSRIRCESWQFRPAQCPVPGIVDASVANVIAGDCRPGNWGWDRNGVFVNNGCRANFNVVTRGGGYPGGGRPGGGGWGPGGGRPGAGQVVRCESWNFRPARCPMDTRGGVRIQQTFSRDCTQGNWGFDRNGVWVINGCRADFVSGNGGGGGGGGWGGGNGGGGGWAGGNGGGGGYPGVQIIECNSINYRPARCPAVIQSRVEIDRVLGGECIQNRSWGFDGGAVWVNNGCRARFRVF